MECTSGYCNKPAQELVQAVSGVIEGMPERRKERQERREERQKERAKCKEQTVPWWFWLVVGLFVLMVISVFIAVVAFALGKGK